MVANDAARFSGRVRGFSPRTAPGGRFMRRMVPGRAGALVTVVAMTAMAAALAQAVAGPMSDKKKSRPPKIQETVGDLSYVVSNGEMTVEGVGLVTGLDNTGRDSPPSHYRKMLV